MKREVAIRLTVLFFAIMISACSSPGPVFSVQMEPGFDGYYVQNSENKFLPLEKIERISFKEKVKLKDVQYKFCEVYSGVEFKKISKIDLADYRMNAIKGDSGRPEGDDYKLYKITVNRDSKGTPKEVSLCALEIKSKLAMHGTTAKIKPKEPLLPGFYYLKDGKWFIVEKSRYFEIIE